MNLSNKYQEYRDELVGLLSEVEQVAQENPKAFAITLSGKTPAQEIAALSRKFKENQFKIVLAGTFQGGKSTTFNAICGGRNLSPTGSGIKTSACLVEAINIADEIQAEYAEVFWRTNEEILSGFSGLFENKISQYIKENNLSFSTDLLFSEYFDLSKKECLDILKHLVSKEFEIYESNKLTYNRNNFDLLCYAKIVADFIDNENIKTMRKSSRLSIKEAFDYIKFPEKFNIKFGNEGKDTKFNADEISFAFVRKITLHIKSPELEKLGCVLVDAPGLNASAWDTYVTQRATDEADAILFLCSAEKEIEQSAIDSLKSFVDAKGTLNTPIFIGFNQRKDTESTDRIVASSMARLKSLGFSFDEENTNIFNAMLSLNSLMFNEISEDKKAIRKMGRACEDLDLDDDVLDDIADNLDLIKEKSGLPKMLEKIEKFILDKKGKSSLIDTGANRVEHSIASVSEYLAEQEADATRDRDANEKNWLNEDKRLACFTKESRAYLDKSSFREKNTLLLDSTLEAELCQYLNFKFFSQEAVLEENGIMPRIFSRMKNEHFGKFRKGTIPTIFVDELQKALKEILPSIYNSSVNHILKNAKIKERLREIHYELNEKFENDFEAAKIKKASLPVLKSETLTPSEFSETKISEIAESISLSLWDSIKTALIHAIPLILKSVLSIFTLNNPFKVFAKGTDEVVFTKMQELLFDRKNGISMYEEQLLPEFKSISERISLEATTIHIENIRNYYQGVLSQVEATFKQRKEEAFELYAKSQDELEAVAKKANLLRTKTLEPLQEKVKAFSAKVEQSFE